MEQYPILAMIVRFGSPVSIILAMVGTLLALFLLYLPLGWVAFPFAAIIGGVIYVLAKSYVELIVMITEMLVPR